ncbi:hypothetical protein DFP72DRAFT_825334 [Ephemerocybe angulata]|uniref:Integrase core domain-containing protein n=1 Tax=Ephemerocybe angulata TaxID=980116 RepID=A0A8H6HCR8_9AGAR|nr:hypothetical protein DFP72DRAFT_825334 [Tulosesus angulatus]
MPNPAGNNQWGEKNYPPDDDLREALLKCVKLKYSRKEKLAFLESELNLKIGETKLRDIEDRLEIPTIRKPRLPKQIIREAASDMIKKDLTRSNGPNAFKSMLQDEYVMIPRDDVRELMHTIAPEGFEERRPGAPRKEIPRVGLVSLGPFHEISADGHEKLNSQALQMGDISLPIYAYRDKWSGYILKIIVIPDARKAAPLAHVYLDLVREYSGIPIQLTTDKGSERVWQHAIQDTLRRFAAPNISRNVYPTAVALKSVHNTVIESLWRWVHRKTGKNLKDVIAQGQIQHIFQPHQGFHSYLFYWIFVPLIEDALDKFKTYWNHHRVRIQHDKHNPSGHVPADAFQFPKKHNPNAINCFIRVPEDVQAKIRQIIEDDPEVGPRDQYFLWYPEQFRLIAESVYSGLGKPKIDMDSAWAVFKAMSPHIASRM